MSVGTTTQTIAEEIVKGYNNKLNGSLFVHLTNKSGNGSSTNNTTDNTSLNELFYSVAVAQACISVIGMVFNALNIYVLVHLVRRRRGISPTYHLLIAMGVADFMTLFVIGFFTLNVYTRDPPLLMQYLTDDHSDFYHVLHYIWPFFGNPFSIASNWLVVATTVFRFLAVAFPMKVCQWCTLLRMRLSIGLIFFLAVCMNIPDWFTVRGYTQPDGRIRVEDTALYDNMGPYSYIYHTVEIYIPFILDFVLVIILIINLNSTTASMANSMQDGNAAARQREHRKISVMLIGIVLWFLLCNIPVLVYHLMRDTSNKHRAALEQTPSFLKFSYVKDLGPILNHAGNIVLYCLCNSTYRRMFFNTLLCRKKQLSGQSQHTTMTQVSSRHEYVAKLRETREDEHKFDRNHHGGTTENTQYVNSTYSSSSRETEKLCDETL